MMQRVAFTVLLSNAGAVAGGGQRLMRALEGSSNVLAACESGFMFELDAVSGFSFDIDSVLRESEWRARRRIIWKMGLTIPRAALRGFRDVKSILRSTRESDVVVVMDLHSITPLLAMLTPRPLVAMPFYHGATNQNDGRGLVGNVVRRARAGVLKKCVAVICVSEAEREALKEGYGDEVVRKVVGAALPPVGIGSGVAEDHPVWLDSRRRHRVIFVGRLVEAKGVQAMIRASSIVGPDAEFLFIGTGPYRDTLERVAKARGVAPRMQILSNVPGSTVASALMSATVFASVSLEESFGISAAEALAAGVPCVLSDIPAHRELVERFAETPVQFVQDDNPDCLAGALTKMSASRPGPAGLRSRAAADREFATEFSRCLARAMARAQIAGAVADASPTEIE